MGDTFLPMKMSHKKSVRYDVSSAKNDEFQNYPLTISSEEDLRSKADNLSVQIKEDLSSREQSVFNNRRIKQSAKRSIRSPKQSQRSNQKVNMIEIKQPLLSDRDTGQQTAVNTEVFKINPFVYSQYENFCRQLQQLEPNQLRTLYLPSNVLMDMNEFMRNQNIESATTRFSSKQLEKLNKNQINFVPNYENPEDVTWEMAKYGGRHTGSRQMLRYKQYRDQQSSEESYRRKNQSPSKLSMRNQNRYKKGQLKQRNSNIKIQDLYTQNAPNIFEKKQQQAGVMTAQTQIRQRANSKDTMIASCQYKSFEGLKNQKLIESYKPPSRNPFANKHSLPDIQSQVPEKYLNHFKSVKKSIQNAAVHTPTPQRNQTPRDIKANGQLFQFQEQKPLSPLTNTNKKKKRVRIVSPPSEQNMPQSFNVPAAFSPVSANQSMASFLHPKGSLNAIEVNQSSQPSFMQPVGAMMTQPVTQNLKPLSIGEIPIYNAVQPLNLPSQIISLQNQQKILQSQPVDLPEEPVILPNQQSPLQTNPIDTPIQQSALSNQSENIPNQQSVLRTKPLSLEINDDTQQKKSMIFSQTLLSTKHDPNVPLTTSLPSAPSALSNNSNQQSQKTQQIQQALFTMSAPSALQVLLTPTAPSATSISPAMQLTNANTAPQSPPSGTPSQQIVKLQKAPIYSIAPPAPLAPSPPVHPINNKDSKPPKLLLSDLIKKVKTTKASQKSQRSHQSKQSATSPSKQSASPSKKSANPTTQSISPSRQSVDTTSKLSATASILQDGKNKDLMSVLANAFQKSPTSKSSESPSKSSGNKKGDLMGLFAQAFQNKLEEQKPELFDKKKQMARVFEKAMTYKFQLNDISKYSSNLKVKDTSWKFQTSATGKKQTPWDEEEMSKKQRLIRTGRQEELKNEMDWADTPLYTMYEKHGRWIYRDPSILSYAECKVLYSTFKSLYYFDDDNEEFFLKEQQKQIDKHKSKIMKTTEVLMSYLSLHLYWENLKYRYTKKKTTIYSLGKMMARNIKLYAVIDQIMNIFKIIKKIDECQKAEFIAKKLASMKLQDEKLCQRLIANIHYLGQETTILPDGFNFKGKDLLAHYEKKLQVNTQQNDFALKLKSRIKAETKKIQMNSELMQLKKKQQQSEIMKHSILKSVKSQMAAK